MSREQDYGDWYVANYAAPRLPEGSGKTTRVTALNDLGLTPTERDALRRRLAALGHRLDEKRKNT